MEEMCAVCEKVAINGDLTGVLRPVAIYGDRIQKLTT